MSTARFRMAVGGLVGCLSWVCLWQFATTVWPFAEVPGLPTAFAAFERAATLGVEREFWSAVAATLVMALIGLAAALVGGVSIGVITGLSRFADELLDPTVQFMRALPPVVILPLVLLVLGPSSQLGIFLAAFAAVWPVLVHTQVGVRDVDPVALDAARSLSLGWMKTQWSVVLPSALPNITTGARIAASNAVLLAIGCGLLAGSPGLGSSIAVAQRSDQPDLAFALILWGGVLGLAIAQTLKAVESRTVHGRPVEELT